ncbi:MAG: efflux RND transporter periplasmic adaptor subunit [Bacteroidales bacterium]|nr:efflux RND transporter periplasmic adaptor subunit [Bacteroidales bacterium]MDD4713755.1 efflux RND transporter periplasmic adaptor subunit [Bacteroidales bacterium]
MKKKTVWILVFFVLLLACLIKVGISHPKEKEKSSKKESIKKVNGFVVKPSLLINEITVSGSLLAFEEVELKNEVAGRVVKINLPEGKFVRKGTLLVKLFDDDLQAGLRKFKSQLDIQKQIHKRQSELLKVNGISQNDYEATGLQVNSLIADIEEQKAQIRKTEVLAPFDGVIGLRNISVGAIVSSSTPVATIRSESHLKLDFFIPEKYGSAIKKGMKVKFSLSGNDKQYDATVLATERGISEDTRNLKARAVVSSRSEDLIPGAFANVTLRLGENKTALVIPTQAIIPQENEKQVIVAKKGKAHFIFVKTGIRKATGIEITEGIQPGDTIITNGVLFLKEGSKLLYSKVNDKL